MSTIPGIHSDVEFTNFDSDEQKIIETISKEWRVTFSGKLIRFTAGSVYKFILIKPVEHMQLAFNIERELICVFSPYDEFQPRALDAISKAQGYFPSTRVEPICSFVVSRDLKVQEKLQQLLQSNKEAQLVIPFTYDELLRPSADSYLFRNRMRAYFYNRDLFAVESPLKTDLFFFGRTDLVHQLVNRHMSDQVSAVFGLRKSGKTSLIYGVHRALLAHKHFSVFIDCQTPAFHQRRWNQALWYVLNETVQACKIEIPLANEDEFTPAKAADLFEKYFLMFQPAVNEKSILLTFDEIENASPGTSPSSHWKNAEDYVLFWQTLRSLFQRKPGLFSYLIVGTNPSSNEQPKIHGIDNPVFAQFPKIYIPRFTGNQTRDMVRRLGRLMGLDFDESVYGLLTEDFGGHPYLIRHVCSTIHQLAGASRPAKVGKALYLKAKDNFLREGRKYFEMILTVLKQHYPDEYDMLKMLALGDLAAFRELATEEPAYTEHLQGYGILEREGDDFVFRVDALKEFISAEAKYKRVNLSKKEMWSEISERRNSIEPRLRIVCRNAMRTMYGSVDARQKVLDIFGTPRMNQLSGIEYAELFSASKGQIYFDDLRKMISKHWDCFKNILGPDQNKTIHYLGMINEFRSDAHAKELSNDEFAMLRVCFNYIEEKVREFVD